MKILRTTDTNFNNEFETLLKRGTIDIKEAQKIVGVLLEEIKNEKNAALKRHILKFDKWDAKDDKNLEICPSLMQKSYDELNDDLRQSLLKAYERISIFHSKQLPKSWLTYEENGIVLGQKISAVEKAGLYIPGGKAAYPSSLLMNAIPAIVAGVKEIIVCTPAPNNELNSLLLAAMHLCGVKKAYKVGGASAIAAMAYGTETISKVDVITGPGNIFVATAKKMVFGDVNIDMIAGPSEIGILADENANEKYVAIDLLSQAEHDEMASSILITTSEELANKTLKEIEAYLANLSRKEIASASIRKRGAAIIAKDMNEAIYLMNKIAPEHLEIMTKNPFDLLPRIKHAGAIFMGSLTPEPIGDYIAGPNHTLPTGGTAKFFSPLNVEHFMKKSSIISISEEGLKEIGNSCAKLANAEGLSAHEESVRVRLKDLE
jgi:histidinol dehydrogenase